MEERIRILKTLLRRLIDQDQPQDVAHDYARLLGHVSAQELAWAEEQLVIEGTAIDEIQRANQLHTDLVASAVKAAHEKAARAKEPGHPAVVFLGENDGIRAFIRDRLAPDLQAFLATQADKERQNLRSGALELKKISKHYERKENLLFPYLEKAGIRVPPQVMWGVDDVIRNLLRLFVEAIEQEPVSAKRVQMVYERLTTQIEHMVVKENDVLMPMLEPHMSDEDWMLVARESSLVGYVFNQGLEGASPLDANTWLMQKANRTPAAPATGSGTIQLPSGNLTLEQLTAMLNALPTDLTFIDDEDRIRYFSEGKHQVFTRTRTIIGRDVYLCHPPQLVPRIKKLINAFRSGQKDAEVVLVRKGSRLDLVRYYAVRDGNGQYIGTVEVTEEISAIVEKVTL